MLMEILTYPDPRLLKTSARVTEFGPELKKLCDDMLETMYHAPGVGLAAPQVNVHKQVVVIDIDYESTDDEPPVLSNKNPLILVNPKIVEKVGEQIFKEGCLSVPVGSSRVDLQACKLEYSIVSPK